MTGLEPIRLDHAGAGLVGRLARPDGPGPHPALLVMHNAHGIGRQTIAAAETLAARGWLAIATDMYGDGAFAADPEGAGRLIAPLWADPALLRARVVAWFDLLRSRQDVDAARLAAIGFCFGGQCVLELARSGAGLQAAVSYHGILKTHAPARPAAVRAHVAVYTGARDPYAPKADVDGLRDELAASGAAFTITEFGDAVHGFTDVDTIARPGMAYDPLAHAVSWAGTLALLDTVAGAGACVQPS